MTGQPRTQSWAEMLANVAIGYCVALVSQLAVFPLFGIHVPLSANIGIGLWFTGISIVRSYVLRRVFNAWMLRELPEAPEDYEEWVTCEQCGKREDVAEAVPAGDCYMCRACYLSWREEARVCRHSWEDRVEHDGDVGRLCHRCGLFEFAT